MKNIYLLSIAILYLFNLANSQILKEKIFYPYIATPKIFVSNNFLSYPVINLNGNHTLTMMFDVLGTKNQTNLSYKIVHCTPQWQESDLLTSEYIDGFAEESLTNYQMSFNTLIPYTHYELKIPNDNYKFLLSGNYAVIVYKDDNPDDTVLTMHFYVSENKATVTGKVIISQQPSKRTSFQELKFCVDAPEISANTRYLKVYVSQNERPEFTKLLTPNFINNSKVCFDAPGTAIFPGNNEFRYFDCKSVRFAAEKTAKINLDSVWNFYLLPEKPSKIYSFHKEINGDFVIGNEAGTTPNTDADYILMHFFLDAPIHYKSDIYLVGRFNLWQLSKKYKMFYNYQSHRYELTVPIKQGYYNYCYTSPENPQLIENSFAETHNTYTIKVYLFDENQNYYRLIAFSLLSN